MRPVIVLLALTLSAINASAAWFEVSPPAPTSETPIAITFTTETTADCGPAQGEVNLSGNSVHVRLFRPDTAGTCPPDVRPRTIRIDLGKLPLGDYALTAEYKDIQWRGKFVVRNPSETLFVTSPSGGLPVPLPILNVASVKFGGVDASVFKEQFRLVAIAPPHSPGLVDIDITDENGHAITMRGAIDYFDPTFPPDLTVFERVLFPVLDRLSGAAGAQWVAVAMAENLGYNPFETFNQLDTLPRLRPAQSSFEFSGRGFPHGAVLYVPRQSSAAFSLRVIDSSTLDPGVDLQPVRESQFVRGGILILANVPISSAYRTKVRIYGFDPLPEANVSISASPGWTQILPLQRSASVDEPSYGELDLGSVPELRGRDRVTVQISAVSRGSTSAPIWAFASAVHSTSQRTVIIRPQ